MSILIGLLAVRIVRIVKIIGIGGKTSKNASIPEWLPSDPPSVLALLSLKNSFHANYYNWEGIANLRVPKDGWLL